MPLTFRFEDDDFQSGATLYVSPACGDSVMVATSWLDRTVPGRVALKAAYFDSQSCAIKEPGAYTFSFVNSRYEPGTIDLELRIENGELGVWDDVATDAWYYDAVRFVMGLGLFDEPGEGEFAPLAPMTRAMLAEALFRLTINDERLTTNSDNSEFTDVPEDAWYYDAVMWASSVGVVNGMGNGIFAPDASITREQIATMLHRYAEYKEYDMSESGDLSVFSDANRISNFAREPMAWAVGESLINGMGDGTVAPQGTATRAQVAAIIMRFA